MTLDQDAQLLTDKEQWCQYVTGVICSQRPKLDPQTILHAVRWASMWVDDLKLLIEECPPESLYELKSLTTAAKTSSLERADGLERYPGGVPCIRVCIAAQDAFCLAFSGEAAYARRLLEQD